MFLPRLALPLLLALPGMDVNAHELWIAPERYEISVDDPLVAHFRNGENFDGSTLPYFESRAVRFELVQGNLRLPVPARSGDIPALNMAAAPGAGLVVLAHETKPSTLTYKTWEKFLKFAAHKDFPDAEAAHLAAGWPQENFTESYTRHVKALIAVGDGRGADRALGLETEFIARSNPYLPGFDGQMQVELRYQGAPRADAQIEVFEKSPDGAVVVTLHRSDAQGRAVIPVRPGHHYLFDAVVLRPVPGADPAKDPKAPLWETLWAALSFAVPQGQ